MPELRSPRSGSLGYVPKKRAKRIYPSVNNWPKSDKIKIFGFAGYKAGMTQVLIIDTKKGSPTHGEQISVPITVLDCPSLLVLGVRFYKQNVNGFYAFSEIWDEKLLENKDIKRKLIEGKYEHKQKLKEIEKDLEEIKDLRLIVRTQPRLSGIGKKTPEIFEIGVGGKDSKEKFDYSKEILGKEIQVKDIFKDGEYIDVIGVTKGKGWQGPVKRFGIKIRDRKSHGKRRHVGTMGPETPRMIKWTVPQAGQLGFFRRTEYNKRILKIGENGDEVTPKSGFTNYGVVKGNYVLIEGSVPGPKKRLIMLRTAMRPPKNSVVTSEIKEVVK
ncbi:MAG: 50S ribosomal protein L3 [Candidatus Aenigmarchaeota archaeon]|nr:50S ribosomal protein L3 [Candidatus Aenigmarchaeota archaeon]